MFYVVTLTHEILLHPEHFGADLQKRLKKQLYNEVEGSCSGKYGFIIAVMSTEQIDAGEIIPGRGHVMFPVKYKAIVYRPFKGEVVDAVVTSVNKYGIFAKVGPLTIFVSQHWIPDELVFDGNSNPPCFKSSEQVIGLDDGVRLQILGMRVDVADIFATGSLAGEHLGYNEGV
eukprot:m.101615 g.101615  ORF g.101615 m.101615 type:complete len:173 (-) comp12514_c0_seq2:1996-2514(-)